MLKLVMPRWLRAAPLRRSTAARPWPSWTREPLLHFVVLGALLFAADHWLVGQADDPHTIVVGSEVDDEARQVFRASRGRLPNDDELAALRRVWLDNEILYREGLALQVDKGDTAIRERVIFKALSVVDAGVKLPPVDERVLRDWFDGHRVKYDEPARFDFQEAVLSGDASEGAVRAFVARLNGGGAGDIDAGLRVFKGRPWSNLADSYGPDFPKALAATSLDGWHAVPARGGWRAIRVDAKTAARPADFEALRGVVQQDWTDATLSEQRSAAVRVLAKKYTVRQEAVRP